MLTTKKEMTIPPLEVSKFKYRPSQRRDILITWTQNTGHEYINFDVCSISQEQHMLYICAIFISGLRRQTLKHPELKLTMTPQLDTKEECGWSSNRSHFKICY